MVNNSTFESKQKGFFMALAAYKIPAFLKNEIDKLEANIAAFPNNEISSLEMKSLRVAFGIYEQRTKGNYMVRVRCTAGIITPFQLKSVAELSLRFASGYLHITTRQEIQIHDVKIGNIIPIIRALADIGLSTHGGGGGTVRNIIAPYDSGLYSDEVFDVSPYAVALTSALINRQDSFKLPRKYKISFSNSEKNSKYAHVNDVGFIAQIKNGEDGFKVLVAGGMGRQSQPGQLLHEFIPASDVFIVAEAIKRVFFKYGNWENKHAARLRFLWNSLGKDKFYSLYEEERKRLTTENAEESRINAIDNEIQKPMGITVLDGKSSSFQIWKQRYVHPPQKNGAFAISIPVLFGDISAENVMELANFLVSFGENTIRISCEQNIELRNIGIDYLPNVYHIASKISDLADYPPFLGNAVTCIGANVCQIGICNSRGDMQKVIDTLKKHPDKIDKLKEIRLHISGCPNCCGQHMIADLGFSGKVILDGNRGDKSYVIYGGVKLHNGELALALKIDEINALYISNFIKDVFDQYINCKLEYSDFSSWLNAVGIKLIYSLCDYYRKLNKSLTLI